MDPKFLVVEIDSKEQALQLVQVMLEKGFARLMLLDDLGKHPTLSNKNQKDVSTSTASLPSVPVQETSSETFSNEKKVAFPSLTSSSNVTPNLRRELEQQIASAEDDEAVEEEEDIPMNTPSKRGPKRSYDQDAEDSDYREQIMNMLCGDPEIVPIGVNSVNDDQSASSSEGAKKRVRVSEYHECALCHVRVKTPRSGRWNLQMHCIALHCVGRQYKCKECEYVDYRKSTMRKHTITQHGSDIPPHDVRTDEMRKEWHEAMQVCFPEFAHRTGFLN